VVEEIPGSVVLLRLGRGHDRTFDLRTELAR
jgi:hypothetical protein